MELKDSGILSYSATPIALNVDILQNGAMNILRELANLRLININSIPQKVEATRQLGTLEKKGSVEFSEDWNISDEELCGL
jgi:hypothetical protein